MKITSSFNNIAYQIQYLEPKGLEFSSLGDMATFFFYAISILAILISSGFKFFSYDIAKKIYINKNDIKYRLVATIVIDILISIVSSLFIFIIIDSIDTFEQRSDIIMIIISVIIIVIFNEMYVFILKNIDKKNFNKEHISKNNAISLLIKPLFYIYIPIFILCLIWDLPDIEYILISLLGIIYIISIFVAFANPKEEWNQKMTMARSFQILNLFLLVYSFCTIHNSRVLVVIGTLAMLTYFDVGLFFLSIFNDRYNKEGTYIIYTTNNYEKGGNTKYLTNEIDNNQDFICFYEINNGNDLIILNKSCIHKIELKKNNN